jgi:hypothetical protein
VGGAAAYVMGKDKFKSIPDIIMNDMTDAQRTQLAASVSDVIADLRVEDAALLLPMLLKRPSAKEAVLNTVFAYLKNQMHAEVVN